MPLLKRLSVHELLYFISGKDTSTSVRESLRILLQNGLRPEEIVQAVHLIGPYFGYEMVRPGTVFIPQNTNQPLDFAVQIYGLSSQTHFISVGANGLGPYGQSEALGQGAVVPLMDCSLLTLCTWSLHLYRKDIINYATYSCKVTIEDSDHLTIDCGISGLAPTHFVRSPSTGQ